jgi:hypothetical protein
MQRLGVMLRSKIPIFLTDSKNSEDSILLETNKISYNSTTVNRNKKVYANDPFESREPSYSEEIYKAYESNPIYSVNAESFQPDESDSDLYSFHDKSSAHKIDEWQAAWNVTNAIQVIKFQNYKYT